MNEIADYKAAILECFLEGNFMDNIVLGKKFELRKHKVKGH